jgi:V8-like Glu-specific endopeptidase
MAKAYESHGVVKKAPHGGVGGHAYWTPERQKAAKPLPEPRPMQVGVTGVPKPTGPEGSVKPGRSKHEPERPEHGIQSHADPVADPTAYPFSTCGKLFMVLGGNNFVASAAVVSRNLILTAAHCLHDGKGGTWAEQVTFFPSYKPGSKKSFGFDYLTVFSAWTDNTDLAFDYGFIWLNHNIGDDQGWLGLYWNAPTDGRTWQAAGYPMTPNPPFDGNSLQSTKGTVVGGGVAGTIGMNRDDMKEGSSGGPWITDFQESPLYANGLQSHHKADIPNTEFSPHFTAELKQLYDFINNPANRH